MNIELVNYLYFFIRILKQIMCVTVEKITLLYLRNRFDFLNKINSRFK